MPSGSGVANGSMKRLVWRRIRNNYGEERGLFGSESAEHPQRIREKSWPRLNFQTSLGMLK